MNSPLLAGLFGAWAAVEVALGGFFLQAFVTRRKEREYLVFGLLCFALAVIDAGFTLTHAASGPDIWPFATVVTNTGIFFGTALNVHFTSILAGDDRLRRYARPGYFVAAACVALVASGMFWVPGTVTLTHSVRFGSEVNQPSAHPTPLALGIYGSSLVVHFICALALVRAHRSGRREVRGALVGMAAVVVCAAIDVGVLVLRLGSPTTLPYSFLIYGFGVADALLVRYRRAADELEATARELREATEELTSSYLELSAVQEELFRKRQLASVGELAASIAHEVRNPLAIIANAAANLKRPRLTPEDHVTLHDIIAEEITRLNAIVTELLRYARPMNVRREEVVLADLIKVLGEKLGENHSLELRTDGAEVETVWADPALLRLALTNVVDNARLAMPEGGVIVVSARADRANGVPGVRLDVVDRGAGMDPKTVHRAMDPFFSTRPSGTGLGLPIAGRILEAHGGKLELHSRVGEGTTVTLFVPGKRPEQRSGEQRLSEPRLPRAQGPSSSSAP